MTPLAHFTSFEFPGVLAAFLAGAAFGLAAAAVWLYRKVK